MDLFSFLFISICAQG